MTDEVAPHIENLFERVALIEGMLERMHRPGTVTDIDYSDPTKPRARIGIGADAQGQPVKGPFVPVASFAGARTIHAPVSVGQQMMHISPDGNFENGFLIPYGFSQPIPSPSTDPKNYVDQVGATTTQFKDGKHDTKVGDNCEHLLIDGAQRIKVQDISKLVLVLGEQAFNLKMDALQPAGDIGDY